MKINMKYICYTWAKMFTSQVPLPELTKFSFERAVDTLDTDIVSFDTDGRLGNELVYTIIRIPRDNHICEAIFNIDRVIHCKKVYTRTGMKWPAVH